MRLYRKAVQVQLAAFFIACIIEGNHDANDPRSIGRIGKSSTHCTFL
jgi:hypothetical protein